MKNADFWAVTRQGAFFKKSIAPLISIRSGSSKTQINHLYVHYILNEEKIDNLKNWSFFLISPFIWLLKNFDLQEGIVKIIQSKIKILKLKNHQLNYKYKHTMELFLHFIFYLGRFIFQHFLKILAPLVFYCEESWYKVTWIFQIFKIISTIPPRRSKFSNRK